MDGREGLGGGIGLSDIAVAPELGQRGFPQVGLPDVGSIEAGAGGGGGFQGLPPLEEKVAVNPALVNGVDAGLLRGDGETPFTVTFLSEVAAQDNALGYYIVQEEADGSGEAGLITEAASWSRAPTIPHRAPRHASGCSRRGRRLACSWSRKAMRRRWAIPCPP
jgi:hypothetical protein